LGTGTSAICAAEGSAIGARRGGRGEEGEALLGYCGEAKTRMEVVVLRVEVWGRGVHTPKRQSLP
jgi:hypothetical protein